MSDPVTPSPPRRRASDLTPLLSIVTPTFNEADNVPLLIDALHHALGSLPHEIIVVDDDSPDRTWEVAEKIAATDPTVRVIRRFGASGLSSAVMVGLAAARGEMLAVIDADLQHDEHALVEMVRKLRDEHLDVVVGSRGAPGGGYGEWGRGRRFVSWVATMIARLFLRVPTSDPMSGFFVLTRDAFSRVGPQVNPQGFKILLEFIGRPTQPLRVGEVGYRFRPRRHGETKLSPSVIRSYLLAVVELRLGRQVKGEFVLYSLVGASGVVVNLSVFSFVELLDIGGIRFGDTLVRWSLLAGIAASICSNFLLNNYFTFWERRFRRRRLLVGFAQFTVVSALGVLVHVAVFQLLQDYARLDGLIGVTATRLLHDAIGYGVTLIFNYFLNVNFIWRRRAPV